MIGYGGTEIDLTPPWPRRSMAELVLEATGVDFIAIADAEAAREAAAHLGARSPATRTGARRSKRCSAHGSRTR